MAVHIKREKWEGKVDWTFLKALYASQTWAIRKLNQDTIQSADMKIWNAAEGGVTLFICYGITSNRSCVCSSTHKKLRKETN